MIRPLTIATCLMACGSGLYLYQEKHEVQLLDRTIERAVHDTEALREQSRLLAAEWTMLNDPERLRQFSDTYLSLKTISPSQFTSLADLDSRLPAVQPEVPAHGPDEQELAAPPVGAQASPPPVPDPAPAAEPASAAVADEDLPVPPIPTMPRAPGVASAVHPAEARAPERPSRPVVAESPPRPAVAAAPVRAAELRGAEQRSYDSRAGQQRAAPRVADARVDVRTQAAPPPPRPIVLSAPRPSLPANGPVNGAPAIAPRRPVVAASAPYGGSLLGMAHGSMPPAPQPTPVNATYNAN